MSEKTLHMPVGMKYIMLYIILLVFAFSILIYEIDKHSITFTESYSAWFSDKSWTYLWRDVPTFETHPPIYYSILKLWRVIGSGEAELRLLSAFASLAAMLLVCVTAYICGGGRTRQGLILGWIAGLLFITSDPQLFYARMARPYAFLVLAMSIALCSTVWLLAHAERVRRPLSHLMASDQRTILVLIALGVGLAGLLWLHNVGALFSAVIGGFLLWWWFRAPKPKGPLFQNLCLSLFVTLLCYGPYLHIYLSQVTQFKQGFWLEAPTIDIFIYTIVNIYGISFDFLSKISNAILQPLVILPLFISGIYGLVQLLGNNARGRAIISFLLCCALGPLIISLIITFLWRPVFLERTLLPVQAAWFVILASAPFGVPRKWRLLPCVGLTLVVASGLAEHFSAMDRAEQPWREISTIIADSDAADAPVLVVSNASAHPLNYYRRSPDVPNLIPLPAPYPAINEVYDYPGGGRGVPAVDARNLPSLPEELNGTSTVWYLKRNGFRYDPLDRVAQLLAELFPCRQKVFSWQRVELYRFHRNWSASSGCAEFLN